VLEKTILKEFQDVVGVENINDGKVMTNAYAYNWCMEIFNYMNDKPAIPFSPIPKAIVLPSSIAIFHRRSTKSCKIM
ncbi:MAG: hypothetical protein ACTSPS_10520, partial [Promethearchaeota archaeon]